MDQIHNEGNGNKRNTITIQETYARHNNSGQFTPLGLNTSKNVIFME
jgi:hypothetical protein